MRGFCAKLFDVFLYLALAVFLVGLIVFPREISGSVISALSLCFKVVVPALFPFFVLSSMIVRTGLAAKAGKLLARPMEFLFRLPGPSGIAFFMGILSGYPVGANTALSLYKNKSCSKSEAERLLAFCNNSGPAFVLGSVGIGIWQNATVGIMLYVCHVLASVFTGILFRFYKGKDDKGIQKSAFSSSRPSRTQSLPLSVVSSVRESAENMFYIVAFVVFFAAVIELLTLMPLMPLLAASVSKLTGIPAELISDTISGIFEITTGIKLIGGRAGSVAARLAITGGILGWAGFSVHCQVLSFIAGSGLRAKPYIWGKLIQSAIAAGLTFLAATLYPFKLPALSSSAVSVKALNEVDVYSSGSYLFSIFMIFAALMVAIIKIRGRKSKKNAI